MDEEELLIQTRNFLSSEYGSYIIELLEEMHTGLLASAQNEATADPLRPLDRAVGVKNVIDAIRSPLDV